MDDALPPEDFGEPDSLRGPVTIRQSVAWGELDALGHVNHTVFLRWFENARFAWFERVGIAATMRESGGKLGPILARASCDYRSPVGFPDTILTSARCQKLGRSSLVLRNRVWSEQQRKIVAEGEVVIVFVAYVDGVARSEPIPEAIGEAIRAAIIASDGIES